MSDGVDRARPGGTVEGVTATLAALVTDRAATLFVADNRDYV